MYGRSYLRHTPGPRPSFATRETCPREIWYGGGLRTHHFFSPFFTPYLIFATPSATSSRSMWTSFPFVVNIDNSVNFIRNDATQRRFLFFKIPSLFAMLCISKSYLHVLLTYLTIFSCVINAVIFKMKIFIQVFFYTIFCTIYLVV